MAFSMKAESGGDFENPEPGTYGAVCTRVIDWGTQEWGQFGPKRRVQIVFEIDEKQSNGHRFEASSMYTMSMNEKANLRIQLEGWRGRKFAEGEQVDMDKLIGAPAMLNLVKKDGSNYVNISSISPLPKGMPAIQPEGKTILFSLDEPDWDAFNLLHEKTQEKIMVTPEYKKTQGQAVNAGPNEPQAMPADFDDEIPF